jgi:hypothetical protein
VRTWPIIVAIALLPQCAFGQYPFSGYVYGGPSLGITHAAPKGAEAGLGLDLLLARLEIGALNTFNSGNHTSGTFSAGLTIPFAPDLRNLEKAKLQLFAGAGYTRLFGGESSNAAYFGGGLKYWFRPKQAIGLEVRDRVRTVDGQQSVQIRLSIHFGIED